MTQNVFYLQSLYYSMNKTAVIVLDLYRYRPFNPNPGDRPEKAIMAKRTNNTYEPVVVMPNVRT